MNSQIIPMLGQRMTSAPPVRQPRAGVGRLRRSCPLRFAVFSALSFVLLTWCSTAPAPVASLAVTGIPTSPWGVVSNGLQMSLSPVVEPNALVATKRFEVRIRNVGDKDVQVNLGISLANGKVHLPKAISLILTDTQGQARVLEFRDRKSPGVAGRVDDLVVGLQAGATYTLPVGLDQFWCRATRELQIHLTNGQYRLTAQFVSRGAEHLNSDTAGMQFLNFWRGTLQSHPLEFDIGLSNPPSGWPRMKLETAPP